MQSPLSRVHRQQWMLVLIIVSVALLQGCSQGDDVPKETPAKPVKLFVIEQKETMMRLVYPGRVEASRKVELAFRVEGTISELPVNRGDEVAKGQVIAKLDQQDFLTRVRALESSLAGARASDNEAQLNLQRSAKLLKDDIIAKATYDNALATSQNTRAAVLATEQELKQARQDLQYTTLAAPFNGTIAAKHVEKFQTVDRQEAIVSLENLASLDIVVDLPETIWALIQDQERRGIQHGDVSATFAAYPGRTFPLTPKEFETKANPQTQTYAITMTMETPADAEILPGMTAEVTGFLEREEDLQGYPVPLPAVVAAPDGGAFVWVYDADSGMVAKRSVTTGAVLTDAIIILSGLGPGDAVVAAGAHYLVEGQRVRPLTGKIGE